MSYLFAALDAIFQSKKGASKKWEYLWHGSASDFWERFWRTTRKYLWGRRWTRLGFSNLISEIFRSTIGDRNKIESKLYFLYVWLLISTFDIRKNNTKMSSAIWVCRKMCVWNFLNPNSDPNTFERDRTEAQRRKKMRTGLFITLVVLILAGGVGFGIWRLYIPEVFLMLFLSFRFFKIIFQVSVYLKWYFRL